MTLRRMMKVTAVCLSSTAEITGKLARKAVEGAGSRQAFRLLSSCSGLRIASGQLLNAMWLTYCINRATVISYL